MLFEPVEVGERRVDFDDSFVQPLLDQHRSEAERLLNGMRAVVLLLLAATGAFYAKQLPAAVRTDFPCQIPH